MRQSTLCNSTRHVPSCFRVWRPTNALYLRSFASDEGSWPIRVALQKGLGSGLIMLPLFSMSLLVIDIAEAIKMQSCEVYPQK